MFLTKVNIIELLDKEELIIRPLLSNKQIGEISIDFRLGTDFLVSIQSREPFIDATGDIRKRPISSFFQETKRLVGESFYLYPNQSVLCSTLEYVKLPDNIFLTLTSRSSYSRLGLSISTIIQPGYCGCLSIELTNTNNNPIRLLVGAAIIQAQLFKLNNNTDYFNIERKYICQVRPEVSKSGTDIELEKLKRLFNQEFII